jgi:hypothetical protein
MALLMRNKQTLLGTARGSLQCQWPEGDFPHENYHAKVVAAASKMSAAWLGFKREEWRSYSSHVTDRKKRDT